MEYEPNRKRGTVIGAFIAIVIVVGAAVVGYHTYNDAGPMTTADNSSTIQHPVTSPQDPNASPVHPAPSPNPGP